MKKATATACSFLLFAAMVFSCCLISFANQQTQDIEKTRLSDTDTYYSFDASTKTLTISGEGSTPDMSNNSITQPWFAWRSNGSIEHVVVEEGITGLGNYTFYFVSNADFKFPSTLESIGKYAMSYTNSVSAVKFPEGLVTISDHAFYSTSSIQSINIPKTVTSIGASAFENCTSLSEVIFGDRNMKIAIYSKAFFSCSSLKEITIPRRASLSSYSVGYNSTVAGDVYEDLTMYVFKNSPAHEYAKKNIIHYVLIDEMPIEEVIQLGDRMECTYYENTENTMYIFTFTPMYSGYYNFFSSGDVDVDCTLKDDDANIIAEHSDNSLSDLNFFISHYLEKGKNYRYEVPNYMSEGNFTVTLLPEEIESISVNTYVSVSAGDSQNGIFDITDQIENTEVGVHYKCGYSETVTFSQGSVYNGRKMSYYDKQQSQPWSCGTNYAEIMIGDVSASFCVTVTHFYEKEIVPPSITEDGYTVYTCILCGESYKSDFTDKTGIYIEGKTVLMQDRKDYHPNHIPMSSVDIKSDGKTLAVTDDDGYFRIFADKGEYKTLSAVGIFSPVRDFDIPEPVNGVADVGEVCLIGYDFNKDNYISAKDYALLKGIYGIYDQQDEDVGYVIRSVDYNRDGIISDDDWQWAPNFFTAGDLRNYVY